MMTALHPMVRLNAQTRRLLVRSLLVSALSATGLAWGWAPQWQSAAGLSFDSAAYAQSGVSESEIQNYARSVLQIEPYRLAAYDDIKRATGTEVPPILCHRPSSLSSLDPSIRQTAIDYCNQAIAIVERNSLTITRFNEITVAHQSNPGLASQIQGAMAAIQGR